MSTLKTHASSQDNNIYAYRAFDAIQTARDAVKVISVLWIPTNAENELPNC